MWYQKEIKDIVKDVSFKRDDIVYLGGNRRNINIGNVRLFLIHGNSYESISDRFRAQKYLSKTLIKPDIIHAGHIHSAMYNKYGNTYYFRNSCLMNPNKRAKEIGYKGDKSVFFVDLYLDDNGNLDKIKYKRQVYK